MTTASDGEFRYGEIANKIAHQLPWMWGVSAVTTVADPIIRTSWALFIADTAFGGMLLVAIFAGWYHVRSICEKCARNTPLDTQKAVEKNGRWLRLHHWYADHALWLTILLLALVAVHANFYADFWGISAQVVLSTWFMFQIRGQLKHQLLSPWCPQCRWDGGGDEEVVPEPTPPVVHADR